MRPDAAPLEERIRALKEGRGPLHCLQSELPALADLFPEAFDPGWRRRMAATSGTPWDFGRWLVIVSPDPPPVGPEEQAVKAEAEKALRRLEEEVARAHQRTVEAEAALFAAHDELLAATRKANETAVLDHGSGAFTAGISPEELRGLRSRYEEAERRWNDARDEEQLAVSRYGREANRWTARIEAAKHRDRIARGEVNGVRLPLTDRVKRVVRRSGSR